MKSLSPNELLLVSGGNECHCSNKVHYRIGDGPKLMREVEYIEKETCFAECMKVICEEFDYTRGWYGDFQVVIDGYLESSSFNSGECPKKG